MNTDISFRFDRNKTIKENALAIGVSERTIKNFMAKNEISGIENHYNQRISQLFEIQKQLESQGVKPTVKNLSQELNWSVNTVNKYKKIIEEKISKEGNNFLPCFGIKSNQVIKSISYNQSEILHNIILLHNNGEGFYTDITYGKGKFYEQSKKFYVPQPQIKMDVFPQFNDVVEIEPLGKLPFEDNSIPSLVIDLPFIVAPTDSPSTKTDKEKTNIIFKRFSSFYPKEKLFESYYHFINEAYRVLQNNAICVFKTQACVSGATQLFVPEYSWLVAQQCGFYVLDQFFLIAKNRLHSGKIQNIQHARKYTSTFYVFKKNKKKIDYFSWKAD
jgi:DNA-binding CsgD family transcriptional regulator